jgi:hypothetical protein
MKFAQASQRETSWREIIIGRAIGSDETVQHVARCRRTSLDMYLVHRLIAPYYWYSIVQ